MTKTERFLIPESEEEINNAFKQAELFIIENGEKNLVLLTNTKDLTGTELEAELINRLGKPNYNRLKSGPLSSNGKTIRMESVRTLKGQANDAVIIGFYPGEKMINLLDDTRNAAAIILVPGVVEDKNIANWVETWNPEIFGQEKGSTQPNVDECVVIKALKSITRLYKHKSLSSTRDKNAVAGLFQLLMNVGYTYDPQMIRNWAVQKGWKSRGADELERIAQKVNDGARVSKYKTAWNPDIIKQYEEECKN